MILRRLVVALAVAAFLSAPSAPVAEAQVKNWNEIRYPALPPFEIPKPTTFSLKNGMTVFLMEDRELPLVTVTARIRTGAYWEPADKVGLAGIAGQVMRTGGTTSMSGDSIDDFLNARAASIETSIGDNVGFASMNCLKEDFDAVFKVFVDVLRNPTFAEEKIEVAKVQANAGIARRNDNVGGITGRETSRLVYGADSPVGRLTEYATIAAITRDDLVAWHERFYHPNNVLLGVVGDFDAKEMRKKIEGALGAWPKGPGHKVVAPEFRKTPNPGVFFIEKKDVTQANIRMAYLGILTSDPDYFAVQVMNEVFGGGFAARLFSNVRSKKGLAYSVGGGLGSGFVVPGLFSVGMQTKSQTVGEAIDALYEEIRGMVSNPATDEEIERAKSAILQSFVFNYDSKGKILGQQMTYAYYGMPADFLERYRANIEKVTKEDVARVARKFIDPSKITLLVVGNPADFGRPLDAFGKVTTIDITIPPPADASPKAAKTPAALEKGRKTLARAAAALGGKDAPTAKAVRTSGKMTISAQGQSMTLGQTILMVFPDRIRQSLQTPMGEQIVVMTEDDAFAIAGGAVRPLPSSMVEKERAELGRDLRTIVRYAADPALEAAAAGSEAVDGVPCEVVQVDFRGASSRLWIAADGRVLKQTYQGDNPMTRAPGSFEVLYSDYREIEGRKVPHTQVIAIDGQEFATLTLESFEVDPEVDAALFERPAA